MIKNTRYAILTILTAFALASCLWLDLIERQDTLRTQLDNQLTTHAGKVRVTQ